MKDASFINAGPNWATVGDGAATDWNSTPGPFFFSQYSGSPNHLKFGYLGLGTLALTTWNGNGHNKTDFTMTVNSCCYGFYDGQGAFPPNYYDLRSILRHELGHVIGLCHTPTSGTLMYPNTLQHTVVNIDNDAVNGSKYLYNSNYSGPPPDGGANIADCNFIGTAGAGTYDDQSTMMAYGGRADN